MIVKNKYYIKKYHDKIISGKKRVSKKQAEIYFNAGKSVRFISQKGAHRDFSVSSYCCYSFNKVLEAFISSNNSKYAYFLI